MSNRHEKLFPFILTFVEGHFSLRLFSDCLESSWCLSPVRLVTERVGLLGRPEKSSLPLLKVLDNQVSCDPLRDSDNL